MRLLPSAWRSSEIWRTLVTKRTDDKGEVRECFRVLQFRCVVVSDKASESADISLVESSAIGAADLHP
jgi:hypothetical protein